MAQLHAQCRSSKTVVDEQMTKCTPASTRSNPPNVARVHRLLASSIAHLLFVKRILHFVLYRVAARRAETQQLAHDTEMQEAQLRQLKAKVEDERKRAAAAARYDTMSRGESLPWMRL